MAVACVEVPGEEPILLMMNQACFYDCDDQHESLCHPYQAMQHGITFCLTPADTLTPEGENGLQQMVVEDRVIPLKYDGHNMYLNIRHPTEDEIDSLDIFEITSPQPYEPIKENEILLNRRNKKRKYKEYPGGILLNKWRKRLALAPEDVVQKTFEATTQHATSLEVENRAIPRKHYKSRFPYL